MLAAGEGGEGGRRHGLEELFGRRPCRHSSHGLGGAPSHEGAHHVWSEDWREEEGGGLQRRLCNHLQEAQQRWLRGDWGRGMQI